ncbi:uncharacterized protein JN550_001435 [Neoarthrinium moseri]|uniref:uncharacterized protein n=1 Tax=Neoarthrinium moseri TaxID=1658444 RepID=UPI001FDB21F0|nr:uncharacterized protein JN550_001435 [Neoarthrinium moseri]KAI1875939.1 hypothetical protein JN550_001435 [Neoarthrinium moseri]
MEANRTWHEPVVEVYSNLITPGVCCSAAAYDLANRRWYQFNAGDPAVRDAGWRHDTRLDEVPDDECSARWSRSISRHTTARQPLFLPGTQSTRTRAASRSLSNSPRKP